MAEEYIDGLKIGSDGKTTPFRDAGARDLIDTLSVEKAPAGLSYGNYILSTDAEVDEIINNHIMDETFKEGDVRYISIYCNGSSMTLPYGWRHFLELCKSSTNYGVITAKSYHSSGPRVMMRLWYGGTLKEWEWDNPPMVAGVEYRTSERSGGKPVYRKRVTYTNSSIIGTTSGYADTNISHGISNFAQCLECNAFAGIYPLPHVDSSGAQTQVVTVDSSIIRLRTVKTTWSSTEWTFDLRYTKS